MWSASSFMCVLSCLLSVISFLIQLVALPSTQWAIFAARNDLGEQEEYGHYGLWTVCSRKAPHWLDDCDPLDTFFKLPAYAGAAGAVGIVHLVLALAFLPLAVMRALQVIRNVPDLGIRPQLLCILKVTIAFGTVILAVIVVILSSVGENRSSHYVVRKGWAFWMQTAVIIVDVALALVCSAENIRYWQQQVREAATRDPMGEHAETYGNPIFETNTPETARREVANGSVSYTDASGQLFLHSEGEADESSRTHSRPKGRKKQNGSSSLSTVTDIHVEDGATIVTIDSLTYGNQTFKEQTPPTRKKSHHHR